MHVSKALRRLAVVAATSSLLGAVPFAAPASATVGQVKTVSPNGYANSGSVLVTLTTDHAFTTSGLTVEVSRNGYALDTITVAGGADSPQAYTGNTPGVGTTIKAKLLLDNTNPGFYDIKVGGSGAPRATNTDPEPAPYEDVCTRCFEVFAYAPDIVSLSPNVVGGNSSRLVDITGSNFTTDPQAGYCSGASCANKPTLQIVPSDGVTIHATDADGDAYASTATRIERRIEVAAGAQPGARDVVVTNTDGKTDTCRLCFNVGPTPTLTAADPAALARGTSGKSVTIIGTNFDQNATVAIDGLTKDTFGNVQNGVTFTSKTWVSSTQIRLDGVSVNSVSSNAPDGARRITVTNPDTGVVASTAIFSVTPPPTIGSVTETDDTAGTAGDGYGQGAQNRVLTITGTNFKPDTVVSIDNPSGITVNSKTFVSATQIQLNITLAQAGTGAPATGNRVVTVTNPDFGTATSGTGGLNVVTGPSVSSLSPASRGKGQEFANLTISGSNFASSVTVTIEDVQLQGTPSVSSNGNTITVSGTVSNALNAAGLKDVTVLNNGDKGYFVCNDCFTVNNLYAGGISPSNTLNDGVKSLTVSGAGFASDATVQLVKDNVPAGSLPNISGTGVVVNQAGTSLTGNFDLTGVAPGAYSIRVTNPTTAPGVGACDCKLNVVAAKPDVTSVTPSTRGAGAQNETITINGTGFAPGASVTFDNAGVTLVGAPVVTPTKITAVVNIASNAAPTVPPAETPQVRVTNTDGQADSTAFTVAKAPTPASVTPAARAQGTATAIKVIGRDFVDGATLLVSGTGITVGATTIGTNADNPSEQTLTATFTVADDAVTGARTVTVRNPDGGRATCATCTFTVNAKPVVDSVSPAKGARGTSPVVTIAGSGFNSGSVVTVSGAHVTPTVTAASPTSITVTLAVGNEAGIGSRDVTVTNTDGGVGTKLAAFKVFTVPGAPTGVTGQRGEGKATVSWTAPIDNGNDALTEYVVTATPGGAQKTVPASETSTTIDNLTNGTAYTFTVAAKNAAGKGPDSAESAKVTPATKPNAPTNVTATPGEGDAVVSWTAPAFDGGSPVTGYTVTSNPGAIKKTVTGTTATVPGLANGTEYTFTVVATNDVGDGAASAASAAVRPFTEPDAPTAVSGTPAPGAVNLQWTAPAFDGGRPVSGYTITVSPGDVTKKVPASMTSAMVDGLTNGTPYTFTVHATNERGDGPASAASDAVTPFTKPGAPGTVQATPADGQVTVTWTAPESNGGNALTGYVVTLSPGDVVKEVGADTLNAVVTGLTNGTAYTATVGAKNAAGTTTSEPSAPVTPRTVPGAPTAVQAVRGDQSATVSWTAPESDGGSPVTGYTVTVSPGGTAKQVGADATSTVVSGLTNGTPYTFTVVATNVAGDGAASSASAPVTPAGVPTAPATVVASGGTDGTASVSWTAASPNGSDVTSYTVTASPGGATKTVTAASRSTAFSGLTDGTPYTFTVKAVNAVGTGAGRTSDPVTPRASTGLSLSATSQIVSGGTTTLRGVLSKLDSTRLVGQQIRIYAKPAGASSFTLVRYLTTGSDGSYVTTFKPTKNTTYVAVFPGTSGLMPYRSAERVTKVAYKITAAYSLSGRTLTVSGAVSPNAANRLIYLRHRRADGSLVTIGQAYVQSNGTYRIVRTLAAGTYNTFVHLPATSANLAGNTAFKSVTIR